MLLLLLLLFNYYSHHCCLHHVCLYSNCLSIRSCPRLVSVPRHPYISLDFQSMMPPYSIYLFFSPLKIALFIGYYFRKKLSVLCSWSMDINVSLNEWMNSSAAFKWLTHTDNNTRLQTFKSFLGVVFILQYALIHQSDARTGGWYKKLFNLLSDLI